jgi:hypothetical protein
MARSVAAVEGSLAVGDFDNALRDAITESRTQIQGMSPEARLGWLGQALTQLGMDTKCLSAARKLAETERQLSRHQHERQTLAMQRRAGTSH